MNWKSFTESAWMLPLLLAMMCLLAGCSPTLTTHTAATEKAIASDVCRAWKPVTYSSRDTTETQTEARANNVARDTYCPKP